MPTARTISTMKPVGTNPIPSDTAVTRPGAITPPTSGRSRIATPCTMLNVATVATTGVTRSFSIKRLLNPPTATTATASRPRVAAIDDADRSGRVIDTRTTVKLITEPIEMSNRPASMVNCCPSATNASGSVSTSRLARLKLDQNTGDRDPV